GATIATLWPRSDIPCASSRFLISCPPHPHEDSVWRIFIHVARGQHRIHAGRPSSRKLPARTAGDGARVYPGGGEEFGMLAGLGDTARVQNDDAVGPFDGGEPMCD